MRIPGAPCRRDFLAGRPPVPYLGCPCFQGLVWPVLWLCSAQSRHACCALYTAAHTIQDDGPSDLVAIHVRSASLLVWTRGAQTMFLYDLFCAYTETCRCVLWRARGVACPGSALCPHKLSTGAPRAPDSYPFVSVLAGACLRGPCTRTRRALCCAGTASAHVYTRTAP